jgi:hypothetical protein
MPPGAQGAPGMSGDRTRNPDAELPETGPRRTEFIVLFVWKEPTPSDDLRGLAAGPDGSGGSPTMGAASPNSQQSGKPPRSRRSSRGGSRGGRSRGR